MKKQIKFRVFKCFAFVFVISVTCLPFNILAQQTSWIKQTWGGQLGSLYVDKTGNSYSVGTYNQSGNTIDGVTLKSTGFQNVFAAKYSSKGKLLWAATSSSPNNNAVVQSQGICANADGEVFISGYFSKSLTFDGIEINSYSGSSDIFLTKYSAEGKTIWAQAIGGMNSEYNYEIKLDDSSNCYISGKFSYPFNISDKVFYGTNDGVGNFFLAKFNALGKLIWVHTGKGVNVPKIKVTPEGDLFACGQFQHYFLWGSDTLASKGGIDFYLLKLLPNGETKWLSILNGVDYNYIHSFDFDKEGNAYLLGSTVGETFLNDSLLSNSPSYTYFVYKLNTKGKFNWISPIMRWKDTTEFHSSKINIDFNNDLTIYGELTDRWDSIHREYNHEYGLMRLKLNRINGNEIGTFLYPNVPNPVSLLEDQRGNLYLSSSFSFQIKIGEKELNSPFMYQMYIAKIKNEAEGEKPNILLFPNPTNGLVQIEFENWMEPEIFFELFYSNGRIVQKGSLTNQDNKIDLTGLSIGIYFLQLKGNQMNSTTIKVMKY
ncbi:MAG: T9SS type A sorting domain-containing protein [Bacteroidia bacterium]|nr:T9SS type A sorting domain-containing protein [Bacteroidia bacterium]MCF8426687.1 T9SS type A sorting domain-containing protein [Bacteroidia bacterium]MCF8445973.1 T9SS type A sorting domain-containing protein [Bacteroidia bacterium]